MQSKLQVNFKAKMGMFRDIYICQLHLYYKKNYFLRAP